MEFSQKLLVISSVWPEPNSSAAGGRMIGLLSLFKNHHYAVTFASPAADTPFMSDLVVMGIEKQTIELNSSSFDEYLKELQPDIVLFDRFIIEEQFGWRVAEQCPQALRLLDTVDLHFLREARQTKRESPFSLSTQELQSTLAKREIASIFRCDLSLIISEYEMDLLIQKFKIDASLLHYYPLVAPKITESQITQWPSFTQRAGFVMIGNFKHEPNWDATKYLQSEIWPLIRTKIPEAQINIYGAYASQKVEQLHNAKVGFNIMGRASDAQTVVRSARVCMAPLRFGAGVKGKLVEAMICGTPSVTTFIGAEGLQGKFPWSGIIANTPEEISAAAIGLYTNSKLWTECQLNGIEIVNSRNSSHEFSDNLLKRISLLFQELTVQRENNFFGSLLMHHGQQSTKYMSKWIEEKNKKINRN